MNETHLLGLRVDGRCKLLLRHRLALSVLLVHASLSNGPADASNQYSEQKAKHSRHVDLGRWLGLIVTVKLSNPLVVGG
jgi:hypothetical protein